MAPPMERTDPSRPKADREDLRNVEVQLRSVQNAMARSRQNCRPSPPHRHRLQPQAHTKHSSSPTIKVAVLRSEQSWRGTLRWHRLQNPFNLNALSTPAHKSHNLPPRPHQIEATYRSQMDDADYEVERMCKQPVQPRLPWFADEPTRTGP